MSEHKTINGDTPSQAPYALSRAGFMKNWVAILIPTVVAVSCAPLWYVASLSAAMAMVLVLIDQRKAVHAYLIKPSYGPKYQRLARVWLALAGVSVAAATLSLGAHILHV